MLSIAFFLGTYVTQGRNSHAKRELSAGTPAPSSSLAAKRGRGRVLSIPGEEEWRNVWNEKGRLPGGGGGVGADLGERAGDKRTFGERRVTNLAEALRALGTLQEAERSAGSGDRGAGQGVGHRKHNKKQCGGRIQGSGLRIKGAWLRVTGVGLRIRRARRKIEGAGRSGESPGARRSWRPRRGTVPEDEARKRRRGQGRGPAQGARTRPPPCPRPPLRSDQGPASPPPRPPAAVPRAGSA